MRIDPSVSYKDLVLGEGGIPQVVDKSGKLAGLASLHEILGVIFGNIDEKLATKPTTPTL